jgi:hypothetical protein
VAGGGYENLQIEKSEEETSDPNAAKGYTLQGLGEVGFLDSVPGFSLLAGGGLRYSSLKAKEIAVESTLTPLMAAVEAGVEFSAIPLLRLQGLVGYDYGLSGKYELEGDGVDLSLDLKKFNRVSISARALLTVAPFVSLGLEPTWYTGEFGIKENDGIKVDDVDFTGWAVKAVAAFTL